MAAPRLTDELEFIASAPARRADDIYFHHTINRISPDAPTDHTIRGVTVTIQAGNRNKLHEVLHKDPDAHRADPGAPAMDIKSVTILCDVLRINSAVRIPEADVSIFARKVVFGPQGVLDTSPLPWRLAKAADAMVTGKVGEHGADGRHAGKITLFCMSLDATDASGRVLKNDGNLRLFANGGAGQAAGEGRKGQDGQSVYTFKSHNFPPLQQWPFGVTKFKPNFSPPAYYAHAEVRALEVVPSTPMVKGSDSPPTDGTDALAPGRPGSAGNAGLLTTNLTDAVSAFQAQAGAAGAMAASVTGGTAGQPTECARYEMIFYYDMLGSDDGRTEVKSKDTKKTKSGASFTAEAARKAVGQRPAPVLVNTAQAWLHPELMRLMLMVIRDTYLANDLDAAEELLAAYEAALSEGPPEMLAASGWSDETVPQWHAAAAEVATLRQRLARRLDYFGNPAGYAPLLSLPSALRAYDLEVTTALRTLLLARWVASKARAQDNAANAANAAIEVLNENSKQIVGQMAKAKDDLAKLDTVMDDIAIDLGKAQKNLLALHTDLLREAGTNTTKKAHIKFAVNVGAALLQVIPFGQPVLGTIGNLASVIADYDDKDPTASVEKAGKTVTGAITKAKEAKSAAEKAMKEAVKEAKTEGKTEEEVEAIRKKRPSAWSTAGKGIGPAITLVTKAVSSLQVPESEVEAELSKLKAKSDKWAKISDEIRALGEKKARFFAEMIRVVHQLSEGYARASMNASAVVALSAQRNVALAVVDPAATQFVADMGQRAQIALTTTLYYLVRAYETTVFKPADVNWAMMPVFEKIEELLNLHKDKDVHTVLAETKVLAPIFEENVGTLRKLLLRDAVIEMENVQLELSIGPNQAEDLAVLNETSSLRIDPLRRGLILPRHQQSFLSKVELDTLTFAGQPPTSGNAMLTLTVDTIGIVRVGERLYGVRRDAPRVWTWTYGFARQAIAASVPSLSSLDLLNTLLQTSTTAIRQKLALPPMWSDLTLEVTYSDLPPRTTPPKLADLVFNFFVDWLPARTDLTVLDLRSNDPSIELVLDRADSRARRNGLGNLYRVFGRGADVTLEAKPSRGWAFKRWEVDDQDRVGGALALNLKAHTRVTAVCEVVAD